MEAKWKARHPPPTHTVIDIAEYLYFEVASDIFEEKPPDVRRFRTRRIERRSPGNNKCTLSCILPQTTPKPQLSWRNAYLRLRVTSEGSNICSLRYSISRSPFFLQRDLEHWLTWTSITLCRMWGCLVLLHVVQNCAEYIERAIASPSVKGRQAVQCNEQLFKLVTVRSRFPLNHESDSSRDGCTRLSYRAYDMRECGVM